jgi:Fe-S cluster biosynthesis and repair protein YggX
MQTIFCKYLNKEAEALKKPPFPGQLGQTIFENISKEAWKKWLTHQTMLINEYRLSMVDAKAQTFLKEEMQKFLFEGTETKPDGFTSPE